MISFEPGDVVFYVTDGGRTRIGVVTVRPENSTYAKAYTDIWAYWRYDTDHNGWWDGPRHADLDRMRPYPDPDPILAEFAAWMLTR